MEFTQAVRSGLQQYAVFSGRARRSEYWWFVLFEMLCQVVANIVAAVIGDPGVLSGVVSLALLLPTIAVAVRRLHDIDRSGWWLLIGLVPVVGIILLIVWYCRRGTPGPNRFGPDPFGGAGAWSPA